MEYYAGLENICLERMRVTKQCIQQDSYVIGGKKIIIYTGKG